MPARSLDGTVLRLTNVQPHGLSGTGGFDVFALDTRGFGRSTHPDAHMTTKEASEDLNAVSITS
jgi:pimeloyl-ACP methyl ester carboxylesterase